MLVTGLAASGRIQELHVPTTRAESCWCFGDTCFFSHIGTLWELREPRIPKEECIMGST